MEITEGSGSETTEGKIMPWCWSIVKRRLAPDADLFEEGDIHLKLSSKYIPVEQQNELQLKRIPEFPCGIANCSQTFNSLAKYEAHYHSCHRNMCQTCHRIFPTSHLLELHILETHDVMFSLLAEKQNMYQCLLEDCMCKFQDTASRREHMVKVHKYPSNYRYDRSKHKRGKKKEAKDQTSVAMETDKVGNGEAMDQSGPNMETTSTSGRVFSYKVPKNISFGHGVSRGFLGGRGRGHGKHSNKKHWHNKDKPSMDTSVDIENVDMTELKAALT